MITKGADGSRSTVFMVPVKVLSAEAGWWSETLQYSGLAAGVYFDNEMIIERRTKWQE